MPGLRLLSILAKLADCPAPVSRVRHQNLGLLRQMHCPEHPSTSIMRSVGSENSVVQGLQAQRPHTERPFKLPLGECGAVTDLRLVSDSLNLFPTELTIQTTLTDLQGLQWPGPKRGFRSTQDLLRNCIDRRCFLSPTMWFLWSSS